MGELRREVNEGERKAERREEKEGKKGDEDIARYQSSPSLIGKN